MPLDSLLGLIETLKQRIAEHRTALRQSEALTRYALIDPFLREMGWDTEDPGCVFPEYRSGKGSVDYALLSGGKAGVMIEAKRLDTPLQDVVAQGIQYCLMEGTQHFIVTDGSKWEVFETHRPVPIEEKLVVKFDLLNDAPEEVCGKALVLWRTAIDHGQLSPGQTPLARQPAGLTTMEASEASVAYYSTPPEDWQPFTNLNVGKGHKPPIELLLPDGSRVKTPYWKSVLIESVRWAIEGGTLTASKIPLRASNRFLISDSRVDPRGKPMRGPVALGSFFLETNYSASACVRNSILAVKHAGLNPAEFKVRFS